MSKMLIIDNFDSLPTTWFKVLGLKVQKSMCLEIMRLMLQSTSSQPSHLLFHQARADPPMSISMELIKVFATRYQFLVCA